MAEQMRKLKREPFRKHWHTLYVGFVLPVLAALFVIVFLSVLSTLNNRFDRERDQGPLRVTSVAHPSPTPDIQQARQLTTRWLGTGSDGSGPVSMASKTQNISALAVTFFAVSLDVSTDNIWIQARSEIPPGQEGTLQFFGSVEGTCYFPIILEAVTYAGKAMMDHWMTSGGHRRLTSVEAYGLVIEYERGPKFCLPQQS